MHRRIHGATVAVTVAATVVMIFEEILHGLFIPLVSAFTRVLISTPKHNRARFSLTRRPIFAMASAECVAKLHKVI